MNVDWTAVSSTLERWASISDLWLGEQAMSLRWTASKLRNAEQPGLIIADEVGLGKTRLAVAAACATQLHGGRIAILVPPSLMSQWKNEFKEFSMQLSKSLPDEKYSFGIQTELRSYLDLFEHDEPVSVKEEFFKSSPLLISHYFGVPQNLSDGSNEKRWLLPTRVKKLLERDADGREYRGLNQLDGDEGQIDAVEWLEKHLRTNKFRKLQNEIKQCNELKPAVGAEAFKDKESEAYYLFSRLIGELIGPADLLIIDEVHKSREGANPKENDASRSRLSACIKGIIEPTAEAAEKKLKRIALSATPLELDPSQWADILARVGLDTLSANSMTNAAVLFASSVKNVSWQLPAQVEALISAANDYQQSFGKFVTRRRWSDHDVIKSFIKRHPHLAAETHPHRKWHEHKIKMSDLTVDAKWAAAACESLALLARGGKNLEREKSFGARNSSAQNIHKVVSEATSNQAFEIGMTGLSARSQAARTARLNFWRQGYLKSTAKPHKQELSEEETLHWHPKILAAIKLIESLSDSGEKVLVFGAFNEPLHALTDALNVRRYIRDVLSGQPTLPPPKKHDNLLLAWRHYEPSFASNTFDLDAENCHNRYRQQRENILEACRKAAVEFTGEPEGSSSVGTIVSWLSGCLSEQLSAEPTVLAHECSVLIESMLEKDHDEKDEPEVKGSESKRLKRKQKLVCRLLNAIRNDAEEAAMPQVSDSSDRTFTRSRFARMLSGEAKRSTRKTLQMQFNNPQSRPQILVAQAAVASEGLNLHFACRKVVLFHLDWNPTKTEQQIGRVDREKSFWMEQFFKWFNDGSSETAPQIEVYTIALEGSYDEHRHHVIRERKYSFYAQMFGKLAEESAFVDMPENQLEQLKKAAPNFRPTILSKA
jgi:hypothetical protein